MKEKSKLFLIIVLAFLFVILINIQEPWGPEIFVENRTVDIQSNLLFDYEITRYPSSVEITTPIPEDENVTLGFIVDPWNLKFGLVPGNGTYVKRNVVLTNLDEKETRVSLNVYGNISKLVHFSKNDFILQKGENVSVDVYLFTNNTGFGNYSGEIDVVAKKPIYSFINP